MKKPVIICILITAIALMLNGCETVGKDEFTEVSRMLAGINTYSVTAEIIVKGNRMVENYVITQFFKYPDKYRLEVLSPADKKGKTTIYDGKKLWIHHPLINQSFELDDLKEVEETNMFPGYFASKLFTGEDASYGTINIDSKRYISIKTSLPTGNNYRKYQVLYVDSGSYKPAMLEVYDSSDNIAVTVYYKDFLYNVKLDDNLFIGETPGTNA